MNYIVWIIAGFVCLGASSVISSMGDVGVTPADRLPFYIAALTALTFGAFCFIKGGGGAITAIRQQLGDAPPSEAKRNSSTRPAMRKADSADETTGEMTDFDPDQALARYMARRDQAPLETEVQPQEAPVAGVRPARRMADVEPTEKGEEGFDPDQALARYMARREASGAEARAEAQGEDAPAEAPAQPFPPELRPAVRPTFGRKAS